MTALDSRSVFSCLVLAAATILMTGCEREPLDLDCTSLAQGDLVVSELYGKEYKEDTWWIELFNTTGEELDLVGVTLNIKRLDGSGEGDLVVRDRELRVAADDFVVLGRNEGHDRPEHVDFLFEDDFAADLFPDGIIQVLACGELVDRLVYYDLPSQGSLAFDGGLELTAEANDEREDWCVDDNEGGISGTPGENNLPCE